MNRSDFPHLQTRRDFFRHAACAAVGTLSLATTIRDLRLINTAAAQTSLDGYKALVCIFLSGGNDSNNLIVPYLQSEYDTYANIRRGLSLPRVDPMKLNVDGPGDGHEYFLHPSCSGLAVGTLPTVAPTAGLWKLFDEGKLGAVFNVGPLAAPMTRAQYQNGSVAKPPQLFSHSDQVTHWQTSLPDQPPRTGWGGRIADLLHPMQYQLMGDGIPTANSAKISLCTSLNGANTFEVGSDFAQYHVSSGGAVTMAGMTDAQKQTIKDIIAVSRPNLQAKEYGRVVKGALDTGETLNKAIDPTVLTGSNRTDGTAGNWTWTTPFPTTSLGNQLKMIARLIQAGPRDAASPSFGLNMKRQIFFASVGGYDTHTSQTGVTAEPDNTLLGAHANLLFELSQAMYAFQRAMEQIAMSQSVTTFTASDFGRTFPTNGQGSDHGWGGHHLVMGGAVRGKCTYGTFPVHQVNGPDDTGLGRWIPKIAVDQYAATLARWFGVSDSNMPTVFPNIGRFTSSDLGFMTLA